MSKTSWVVVRKDTLIAVCELFEKSNADKINRDRYDVLPVGIYLGRFNAIVKGARF